MPVIEAVHWSSNPNGFGPLGNVIGIAIHHTVTTISPDASMAEEEAHARAIDRYHVAQGWGGIGYHYLVFPSGRVYRVGWGQRAHVANRNHELVGIAFVATLTSRLPSPVEIAAAREAVLDARQRVGDVPIRGHRDWAVPGWETSCPGRAVEILDQLEEEEMSAADKARLDRLEQLVAGNGLDVYVSEENMPSLVAVGVMGAQPGTTIRLTGEQALAFAALQGFSFGLGLKLAVDRINALEAGTIDLEGMTITHGGKRYRLVAE